MKTSQRGRAKIKEYEGFSTNAYKDVVGVWTIGYGFTKSVKEGDYMSPEEAEKRLSRELVAYEDAISSACTLAPNQNQFDAMVSFAWNVGIAGFEKSTVLKCHNKGDFTAAARAFGLWNKAGGKVWPGLIRRRASEAAMYLEPVQPPAQVEMPQAVDREKSMTESTIGKGGVVAGGTAALATVSETARLVADTKYSLQSLLGEWVLPLMLGVIVAACAYILWQRLNQRKDGVA